MTEQELVKKCLADICKKVGFDRSSVMTQRDYELISHEIEDKTATLISVSTIKRLLNGEFSRIPQTATLNAISNYLGYKNWQEYKTQQPVETEHKEDPAPAKKSLSLFRINWKWVLPAAAVAGIILIVSFIQFSVKPPNNYSKAQFTAKKTTTNAIPNTVIFNYNVDEVNADSFFIQQSWDRNRRVRIYKKNYTLTDIYYEPGYHLAKLIANDSVIKTIDMSIPTNGWFLLAKSTEPKSIPQYIHTNRLIRNGIMGIDKADLDSNHISTNEEKIFSTIYFPGKLEINSDNYKWKARVRMKETRNNYCPFLMLEIFCQRNFMYFISNPKGCASEAKAQFGETILDGKHIDLSALSTDVTQWMDIEIVNRNRQVTISINNKPALTLAYTHPSGLLTGLGFFSNGLCEVDAVELKGLDGKVFYQNDFEKGTQ